MIRWNIKSGVPIWRNLQRNRAKYVSDRAITMLFKGEEPRWNLLRGGGKVMDEATNGLTISFVDKDHRAAYMEYEGCPITLSFSKQSNTGIRDTLKEVLIGSMITESMDLHICAEAKGVRKCR